MQATELQKQSRQYEDFFLQVSAEADAAASKLGSWKQSGSLLGGVTLELLTAGAMAFEMSRAFVPLRSKTLAQHLPLTETRRLRIRLLTTSDIAALLPQTQWGWTQTEYRSERFSFTFDARRRMLTAVDVINREAIVWFAGELIGAWEHAAPARIVVDRLLAHDGITMLHAGSLGRGSHAILLAGPGGSGKSTIVRAGVGLGMTTVGDDFLLLLPGDSQRVAPLYRTVRLKRNSPSFDASNDRIKDDGFANEKAQVLLEDNGRVLAEQRVVAIASLSVSGEPVSTVESTSTIEVMRALLPSSLILADRRPDSMAALARLARSVPSFRFAFGTDVPQALHVLNGLFDHLGIPCES